MFINNDEMFEQYTAIAKRKELLEQGAALSALNNDRLYRRWLVGQLLAGAAAGEIDDMEQIVNVAIRLADIVIGKLNKGK